MDLSRHGQFRFGTSILVIPDAHARPDELPEDFDRFRAAGKLILDLKPEIVVCLGDLGDFDSLNQHKPKEEGSSYDGKALKRDVGAFKEALKALMSPTRNANKRHQNSRRKDRQWEPHKVFLEGNHEEFWRRYKETEFDGHDYLEKFVESEGWSWHRFLDPVDIRGVLFSHYFTTGVSRKPAGVGQILNKTHRSCVWGHTHSFGYNQAPVLGGGTIAALCAGSYKPPHRTGEHEWSGLTLLTNVDRGSFSIQQFPYDAVLERYGEGDYAQQLRVARANAYQDHEDADNAF